jgi:hypothetical protein
MEYKVYIHDNYYSGYIFQMQFVISEILYLLVLFKCFYSNYYK